MYYVVVVLVCAIRPGCPVGSGIAGVRHALSPRRAVLPRPAPRGTTHPTLRSQGNQGGEQDTQGRHRIGRALDTRGGDLFNQNAKSGYG